MVSKIRASEISEVLSNVPWKNSIRRGSRRILRVGHKHLNQAPSRHLNLSPRPRRVPSRGVCPHLARQEWWDSSTWNDFTRIDGPPTRVERPSTRRTNQPSTRRPNRPRPVARTAGPIPADRPRPATLTNGRPHQITDMEYIKTFYSQLIPFRRIKMNVRPEIPTIDSELYECFECGARVTGPTDRHCERCGGELQNLGKERDL